MNTNQKIIGGVGAALVVVVGGWLFAKHQATSIAHDKIDGFIIRNNLREVVSYADLSASPFGSVSLSGVKVKISPAAAVVVGSLDISDIKMKNDQLYGISLAAKRTELPVLQLARENPRDSSLREAVGLGYTTLTGDLSVAVDFDDAKGTLAFETTGEVKEAGGWKAKLRLAGIDAQAVALLSQMAASGGKMNGLEMMASAGMQLQRLATVSLAEADFSVDNGGLYKRNQDLTSAEMPVEGNAAAPVSGIDESDLVRAGMAPSEAIATKGAVDNWLKKGGSLRVAANLSQPLPLFRNANFFTPAFDSPAGYLVATKSKISN